MPQRCDIQITNKVNIIIGRVWKPAPTLLLLMLEIKKNSLGHLF